MARNRRSAGLNLAAHAAILAPWAGALAALALVGLLHPLYALVAGSAAAVLTYGALRARARRVDRLVAYLEDLADSGGAAPPAAMSPTMDAVERAVRRLARTQARRVGDTQARLESVETILDVLPDPLMILDAHGRVLRDNEAARRLVRSRMVGRDISDCLRDPAILEAVDEVLHGANGRTVETVIATPKERRFNARIESPGEGAGSAAAILLLHDITEMRHLEQMRADFVANASHELRTPITTLIGFVETLKGPARDDPKSRERFLDLMHEQATRMARLVTDLLSLSRIERNVHSAPTDRIHPLPILRRVCTFLEQEARLKKMELRLSVPGAGAHPGDGPVVIGDAEELTQLFQNLVSNAVKYGSEGTPVDIEVGLAAAPLPPAAAHIAAPALKVEVRDRGDGIAPEHIPRLTERFYRVDAARSRSLGGTGLGLAIVKHVVNRHNGAMTIASKLGEGSRFTVYLPLAR